MRVSSVLSVCAPAPAAVSALASVVSGFRLCFVRPSRRSFSGWVCVCVFASPSVAGGFASAVASGLGFPFCRVFRRLGGWGVSVPVFCRWLRLPRRSVAGLSVRRVFVRRRCLPVPVVALLRSSGSFGFSGSRGAAPAVCSAVARAVSPGSAVFVGCARGVDAAFRGFFPSASVFGASAFGLGRGSFAARSCAVVRAVVAAGVSAPALWVSFPSGACPVGLVPSGSSSRAFCGSGSGSWASLAFAAGSGLSCLVFGFAPPAGWGFSSLGCGWWFRGECAWVSSSQLSLF
jgi:hypothetical protein